MKAQGLQKYIESLEDIIIRKEEVIHTMQGRARFGDLSRSITHSMQVPFHHLKQNTASLSYELKKLLKYSDSTDPLDKSQDAGAAECRKQLLALLSNVECYSNLVSEMLDSIQNSCWTIPPSGEIMNPNNVIIKWAENYKCHPNFNPSIRIVLQLNPSIPSIGMRECECYQLMNNLAINAIEAMENTPGGELAIKTDLANDHMTLEVIDNGCGIPAEVSNKIFKPFYTTKWSPDQQGKHHGLGLYTTSRIIEDYGGKIEFSSTPGVLTTFKVSLPLAKTPECDLITTFGEELSKND